MATWLCVLITVLVAVPAWAELALPPGFTAQVYVTGLGFDSGVRRAPPAGMR